jgi:hypothetical protein
VVPLVLAYVDVTMINTDNEDHPKWLRAVIAELSQFTPFGDLAAPICGSVTSADDAPELDVVTRVNDHDQDSASSSEWRCSHVWEPESGSVWVSAPAPVPPESVGSTPRCCSIRPSARCTPSES